ncbi:MAG: hypothetical protein K8U57_25120 [Planctomycetes bacterium]|nr:hypothetical protein [Planctomycetota bacterium]
MWSMVLLMCIRDAAMRVHVSRIGEWETKMEYQVDGTWYEMVPPPAYSVDGLYAILAIEPDPWWHRLVPRFRRTKAPVVQMCWQGRIEVGLRGLIIPVECDMLPHPGGLFISFELAVTAEELAQLGPMPSAPEVDFEM